MRIIEIIASLGSGGAETLVKDLAIGFKNRGHRILVVVVDSFYNEITESKKISDLKKNGVSVISLGRTAKEKSFRCFFRLNKIFVDFKPNVVHIHSEIAAFYCLPFLLKNEIQFVQTIHNTKYQPSLIQSILLTQPIKGFFKKIYCSREAFNSLHKKLGAGAIIQNGIYLNSPQYVREKIVEELKIEKDACLVLAVGRIMKQKNQEILPDILYHCSRNKNVHLILVGELYDSHIVNDLRNKIKKFKLQKNFHFLGLRNDVRNIMNSVDAFISTSNHEGLPISCLEAMSVGIPLILSPIKEHISVFAKEAGVYIPEKNTVFEYSRLIERLSCSDKKDLIEQRTEFIQKYNISNTINQYLKIGFQ